MGLGIAALRCGASFGGAGFCLGLSGASFDDEGFSACLGRTSVRGGLASHGPFGASLGGHRERPLLRGTLETLSVTLGALSRCLGPRADLAVRLELATRTGRALDARDACLRTLGIDPRLVSSSSLDDGERDVLARAVGVRPRDGAAQDPHPE